MDKNINIMALDADFNVLTILAYTNLQWTRLFHEPGKFSLQIPAAQYNPAMKYIYTKDRPELGEISQVNYYIKNGIKSLNISGYFIENRLNNFIVYQKGDKTNITSDPGWVSQQGPAETVAYKYFDAFNHITFTQQGHTISSILGFNRATDQGRGHRADHQRGNQNLGHKLYTILKPSQMSYRVNYELAANDLIFEIWEGVDRTANNPELNNPVIFSTKYGNINNVDLLIADTDYKQSYVAFCKVSQNEIETVYMYAGSQRKATETELDDRFLYVSAGENINDYPTEQKFLDAMLADAETETQKQTKTVSLDFDPVVSSYEYLEDFDIGDKVSLEIPELGISLDALITRCHEVIKAGTWKLQIELSV